MAVIGEQANLRILRETSIGLFLDAGEIGEVFLPRNEMPAQWAEGEALDVFLYRDSEDRPIATRRQPKILPGKVGVLKVLSATEIGAFLDWGLPKDLLLPFREQRGRPQPGSSVVVFVKLDQSTNRFVATQRIEKNLRKDYPDFAQGQEVELLIHTQTDMGYKAVVNGTHAGLLFKNEVFRKLHIGAAVTGYVKEVRRDGKIDLSLYPPGRLNIDDLEMRIIDELEQRGGFWAIDDSTPAHEVHRELGVSKKAFKKATGALFKKRKITFEDGGIRAILEP